MGSKHQSKTQALKIDAVELPILPEDEEATRVWFGTLPSQESLDRKPKWFSVGFRGETQVAVLDALKRVTGAVDLKDLVGKRIMASVAVDGGEITINNVKEHAPCEN